LELPLKAKAVECQLDKLFCSPSGLYWQQHNSFLADCR